MTENFVALELKKQLGWSETGAEMFHFRTSNDREIDIIMENRAGELVAVEVKAGSSINAKDFKNLQMLADSLPKKFKRGIILYAGEQFLSFGKNLYLVPM